MRAKAWEFRYRFAIITAIYTLGFFSPWLFFVHGMQRSSWLWLAATLARTGWFDFSTAAVLVTVAAMLFALTGALLRYFGSAYLGAATVHADRMHAVGVMDAGPFAYLRNPLYVGSFFSLAAISILMPPSGALFSLIVYALFVWRIIGSEQAYLAERIGQPYLDYCRRVPAVIPTLRPAPSALPLKPEWLAAARDECYGFGVVLCYALFAWNYNSWLMTKAVIVNFGVFLVMRALFPPGKHAEQ